jgi:hypothetical protein
MWIKLIKMTGVSKKIGSQQNMNPRKSSEISTVNLKS